MWVCGSTRPGVTSLPPRSQVLPAPPAGASAARPIQAILPAVMPIAPSGTRPNGLSPSMVATVPFVSSRSKATSAYRNGLGERCQLHHLLVPGGELGMAGPPRLVGIAEVEIAQRAADGDLADRVEVAERGRLLLELGDGARDLALLERDVALAALVLRQGELAPAGLRRIEDAVGQRLLRQRLPAR